MLDDSHEPENVWKAQNEEKEDMQIKIKPVELAALAQLRRKLNAFVHWASVAVTAALAAAFLYNVFSSHEPWIRFGQAWAFGLLAYVLGTELESWTGRKDLNEPCASFLSRQHEARARGYLRLRRRLWLLVPSIVASWLGGGPLVLARARGVDPSSWIYQFCVGPWPWIFVAAILVTVWLALGSAAAKARRDLEELRRSVAA